MRGLRPQSCQPSVWVSLDSLPVRNRLQGLRHASESALASRQNRTVAVGLVVAAAALYHWLQSWGRATPWIFPDEARFA